MRHFKTMVVTEVQVSSGNGSAGLLEANQCVLALWIHARAIDTNGTTIRTHLIRASRRNLF
jgi:hypothetical protein